ncbi:Hpt domain-containing protein [Aliihoeflea sp. PC F10.4]
MNDPDIEGLESSIAAALDTMVEDTGGDVEFVNDLIEAFIDDARVLIMQIEAAASRHDREALRRAAHTLKSNSATFGADALSLSAADIEARSPSGELGDVLAGLDETRQRFDAVTAAIDGYRKEKGI